MHACMYICMYVCAAGLHFSVEFHQNEKTDITSPRKRQDNLAEHIPPPPRVIKGNRYIRAYVRLHKSATIFSSDYMLANSVMFMKLILRTSRLFYDCA